MSLLTRIRGLAETQSLSIAKLEEQTHLGNGTIRRWDSSPPSCDKLLRVANTLNVTVDYLLTGNDSNIHNSNLTDSEIKLLAEFRKLDFRGCTAVMNTIISEQDRMEIEKNSARDMQVG